MTSSERTVNAPDGTRVAYEVSGSGPALLLSNGLTTTRFFWKYLVPRFRERYTVVTWDFPGHGRSEPARSDRSASIEGQPEILVRIMDDLGLAQATQVGFSVGCQAVLEFYRVHPSRFARLALLFGPAEHALSNTALPVKGALIHRLLRDPNAASWASAFQRLSKIATLPGGPLLLRASGLIGRGTSNADLRALIADLSRIDPSTCARMACSAESHSARDVLPSVRVPSLIMAGDKDVFAPFERVGGVIHRELPGSTLVRLPEGTHTALLDHPDQVERALTNLLSA